MSFKYKTSEGYCKKIKGDFFNSSFTLNGQKFKWKNEMRLARDNQSADIFILKNENNVSCIGKLYRSKPNQIELVRRLENSKFTEKFIDYIEEFIDTEQRFKIYFHIFDKIEYPSECIPFAIKDQKIATTQLFNAVSFIHSIKILHNDINTNNIMFDGENIKLIDFEFAVDFKTKKYNHLKAQDLYRHPKTWINENYFSKNKDYWAATCSLYCIYNKEELFESLVPIIAFNRLELTPEKIMNEFRDFVISPKFKNCYYINLLKKYF